MNLICVQKDDSAYPAILRASLGERAPKRLFMLGNANLLQTDPLALFCSIRCPGSVILKTYDLARALRDAGVPVIGGFHTPMEKECLDILLRGTQPIIVCPARGLGNIRLSQRMKKGVYEGRVLLLSIFEPSCRRATGNQADKRNDLVIALAGRVFVSHAAPGGKTEALCGDVIAMGKTLFTIVVPENANLIALGARQFAFV